MKVQDFLRRFEAVPDLLELDHLTVSGDVTFGKNVSLKVRIHIIICVCTTIMCAYVCICVCTTIMCACVHMCMYHCCNTMG